MTPQPSIPWALVLRGLVLQLLLLQGLAPAAAAYCQGSGHMPNGSYCVWSFRLVVCRDGVDTEVRDCEFGCKDGLCRPPQHCAASESPRAHVPLDSYCRQYIESLDPQELVAAGTNYSQVGADAQAFVARMVRPPLSPLSLPYPATHFRSCPSPFQGVLPGPITCKDALDGFACGLNLPSCLTGKSPCERARAQVHAACAGVTLPPELDAAVCVNYQPTPQTAGALSTPYIVLIVGLLVVVIASVALYVVFVRRTKNGYRNVATDERDSTEPLHVATLV